MGHFTYNTNVDTGDLVRVISVSEHQSLKIEAVLLHLPLSLTLSFSLATFRERKVLFPE